jgi:hypothetical protein
MSGSTSLPPARWRWYRLCPVCPACPACPAYRRLKGHDRDLQLPSRFRYKLDFIQFRRRSTADRPGGPARREGLSRQRGPHGDVGKVIRVHRCQRTSASASISHGGTCHGNAAMWQRSNVATWRPASWRALTASPSSPRHDGGGIPPAILPIRALRVFCVSVGARNLNKWHGTCF